MEPETKIGLAIRREIDPVRRFLRQWSLYLLMCATIIAVALCPQQIVFYVLIFIMGSNLLMLSIYLEEASNKWLNKTTES